MSDGLIINGTNATTYGVMMGDGFIDTLFAPIALKPFVESKSRLQHGKRVVTENVKMDSRDFTLVFVIQGSSKSDFKSKKSTFLGLLYNGTMSLRVPSEDSSVEFHLVYLGQNAQYSHSLDGTSCKITVKFEEPNPNDRAIPQQ